MSNLLFEKPEVLVSHFEDIMGGIVRGDSCGSRSGAIDILLALAFRQGNNGYADKIRAVKLINQFFTAAMALPDVVADEWISKKHLLKMLLDLSLRYIKELAEETHIDLSHRTGTEELADLYQDTMAFQYCLAVSNDDAGQQHELAKILLDATTQNMAYLLSQPEANQMYTDIKPKDHFWYKDFVYWQQPLGWIGYIMLPEKSHISSLYFIETYLKYLDNLKSINIRDDNEDLRQLILNENMERFSELIDHADDLIEIEREITEDQLSSLEDAQKRLHALACEMTLKTEK